MLQLKSNSFIILLLCIFQITFTTASLHGSYRFSRANNDDLYACLSSSLPSSARTVYPCSSLPNQHSSQYQCDNFNVSELSGVRGGQIPHAPAVVVYPTNSSDVQNVLKCATKLNFIVNALSGGHSLEGYGLGSINNNIVLNMEAINFININQQDGIGTFGAGARLGPIYYRTYQNGNYAVNGGYCPWVGLGGHALGGGYGSLARLYGLLVDNILEIKAVNAEGELLTINETLESELYWALRGAGGGLFVIVTEFKIRLVRPPSLIKTFQFTWYLNGSKLVLQQFQSLLFDPKFNFSNNIHWTMAVDNVQLVIGLTYYGTESEELNKIKSLLLSMVPTPYENITRERDWLSYVYELGGFGNEGDHRQLLLENLTYPTSYFKSKHLYFNKSISNHNVEQLINRLAVGDGKVSVQFAPWDGHLSTFPVDKTAFPHRHIKFGIQFMIYWNTSEEKEQNWNLLNEVYLAVYNDSTKRSFVSYIDRDVQDWMNVYYDTHQQRLIKIKQIYDKNNRFDFERTIRTNGICQQTFFNFYLGFFLIFVILIVNG